MRLSLEAHDLERRRGVDADGRASCHSSDLLHITAQERVTRARVRGETDLLTSDGSTVEETELSVPDPFVILEYLLILASHD